MTDVELCQKKLKYKKKQFHVNPFSFHINATILTMRRIACHLLHSIVFFFFSYDFSH